VPYKDGEVFQHKVLNFARAIIAARDEELRKQEPDGWLAYIVEEGKEIFEFSSDAEFLVNISTTKYRAK
jgi:hypothetical protein